MIGTIAELSIKAGMEADFEAVALELEGEVARNEPGCRLYRLFKSPEEPGRYVFMEEYADQAAVDAHRASDHFRRLGARMGPLLAAPPKITRMVKV